MKTITKLFLLAITMMAFSCTEESEPNIPRLSVKYGQNKSQVYDIYPSIREANRTFVLIHGGGWVEGDKEDVKQYVTLLHFEFPSAVIVNINYTLESNVTNQSIQNQLNDINTVIESLPSQIPKNISILGQSAGSNLGMLYSFTHSNITSVCNLVGPSDLTDTNLKNGTVINILDSVEDLNQISPVHFVTKNTPPVISLYGSLDDLVPTSQSVLLKDKLNEFGVYNENYMYFSGHIITNKNELKDSYQKITNFFRTH